MTPEETHTLFAKTINQFDPMSGQPTDAYLQPIREAVAPILLSIPYGENRGKYNLVGLIMDDAKYNSLYGKYFILPKQRTTYDASINVDAKTAARVRAEATHTARIAHHNIYVVAERNTCQFILRAVGDMWVREIRDPYTF